MREISGTSGGDRVQRSNHGIPAHSPDRHPTGSRSGISGSTPGNPERRLGFTAPGNRDKGVIQNKPTMGTGEGSAPKTGDSSLTRPIDTPKPIELKPGVPTTPGKDTTRGVVEPPKVHKIPQKPENPYKSEPIGSGIKRQTITLPTGEKQILPTPTARIVTSLDFGVANAKTRRELLGTLPNSHSNLYLVKGQINKAREFLEAHKGPSIGQHGEGVNSRFYLVETPQQKKDRFAEWDPKDRYVRYNPQSGYIAFTDGYSDKIAETFVDGDVTRIIVERLLRNPEVELTQIEVQRLIKTTIGKEGQYHLPALMQVVREKLENPEGIRPISLITSRYRRGFAWDTSYVELVNPDGTFEKIDVGQRFK